MSKEHVGDTTPRWDVIEKLHNKIDDEIDEAFRVNRLSFIEVDIALLMIQEKMEQQKMELYTMYMKHEGDHKDSKSEPDKDPPPKDLYS